MLEKLSKQKTTTINLLSSGRPTHQWCGVISGRPPTTDSGQPPRGQPLDDLRWLGAPERPWRLGVPRSTRQSTSGGATMVDDDSAPREKEFVDLDNLWCLGAPPRPRSMCQRKGTTSINSDDLRWLGAPPEERLRSTAPKEKELLTWTISGSTSGANDVLTTGTDLGVKRKRMKRQRNNFVRKK